MIQMLSIILFGLVALTNHWKKMDIHFPEFVYNISIPIYTIIWGLSSLFFGVYDKESKATSIFKSSILGTVIILIFYALLPKEFQFSRIVSLRFYVEKKPRTRQKELYQQIIFQNYEKIH